MVSMSQNEHTLTRLRYRWGIIILSWFGILLGAWYILQMYWPYATRWLIMTSLSLLYIFVLLWRGLPDNHRPNETTLLPTLGLGNHLTLLRGCIISCLAGLIFSPWPTGWASWIPALLYLMAGALDYGDGLVARATNHMTVLGSKLDTALDALGILLLVMLAVWYGQLPIWFIGVGLFYYLFIAGIWWREQRGLPVYPLHPSYHRRIFAGFFMAYLGFALAPVISANVATLGGIVYGLPVTVGFLRDWLVTIGQIDSNSPTYQYIRNQSYRLMAKYLPLVLRFTLMLLMVIIYTNITTYLNTIQLTLSLSYFIKGVIIMLSIAIGLGFLGRVSAVGLIYPVLFDLYQHDLQGYNGLALICTISLMLLGSGYYSVLPTSFKTYDFYYLSKRLFS